MPSFSGPHRPHPTQAQQLPVAGHLQAWRPLLSYAVPLEAVASKELPARVSLGVTSSALGCRSLQHAQPQKALMNQQTKSECWQDP